MRMMCCYCGELIGREDTRAINVIVTSLWHSTNEASQHLVAHSACFAKPLHADIPFDDHLWGLERQS